MKEKKKEDWTKRIIKIRIIKFIVKFHINVSSQARATN